MPSRHRRLVRGAQIQSIADLLPYALLGSVCIGAFLISVAGSAAYVVAGIVSIAVSIQFVFCGLTGSKDVLTPNTSVRAVGARVTRAYVLMAATAGAIWGTVVTITAGLSSAGDYAFVLGMVACATLLVSIYVFSQLVLAVAAFTSVTAICLAVAILPKLTPVEAIAFCMTLVGYAIILPSMTIKSSRLFVARIAGELMQREASEQLEGRLSDFEESATEWFWETDANGRIVKASDDLLAVFRVKHNSQDRGFQTARHIATVADADAGDINRFLHAVKRRQPFKNMDICVTGQGGPVWVRISGKPSINSNGTLCGYRGVGCDVTHQKTAESRIIEMAHYDSLTGLLNRSSFTTRLKRAAAAYEYDGIPFILMFLDLDKFKPVNDTFGHQAGDELLKLVAKRLSSIVRNDDDIARLGGDEFAVLVHKSNDTELAEAFAQRMIGAICKPFDLGSHLASVGTSIGIALAPEHGSNPDELLRHADLALYNAKHNGRGVYRFFDAKMDTEERDKRTLEAQMHDALANDAFDMSFQPKVNAQTGRVVSFEALIRWEHADRGHVSPDEFIPLAEQSNLIVDIGRWTLCKACEIALQWPDDVGVAVNISATHFMRSDILDDVRAALKHTGIAPERLEIEITESLMVEDIADVADRMATLKTLGIVLALDDFGTGYSSLSYLTKFPFDRLKIDKSFISDIETDQNARAVMQAISTLSQNLDIGLTVEGVETQAQIDFLKELHCDQYQGYFYSRALEADELAPYMLKNFAALTSDSAPALLDERQSA